jgi:hypothetical protein
MKTNFTNSATNKTPCIRCGKALVTPWQTSLCHLCIDDNKIRKFLVPEGQQLDEHFFPINPTENVLALTK